MKPEKLKSNLLKGSFVTSIKILDKKVKLWCDSYPIHRLFNYTIKDLEKMILKGYGTEKSFISDCFISNDKIVYGIINFKIVKK